ncbi:RHS repeat-associated core domain-containing protein [Flagellimonas sp. CMM7]|uniref:RHS repeat-associated core domain-containing protein n=1 Tax=Flagellimonas sp. CMM7 TaxID=2654676 RepID=UPI0013D15C1A|nr:RHS repeat-associated core domain-containing protein [Flagellimonas sp. CMM7]UII80114.1 RHS repeat-associated core domain-containing protein [Flagellimonas sp. CMM7]
MKNYYIIAFAFLVSIFANAQSDNNLLVETNASASLNLCGENVTISITISNSSSEIATGVTFSTSLPIGVSHIPMASDYPLDSGSTIGNPIFMLPDVAGNSTLNFTYTIAGSCELLDEFDSTFGDETEFEVSNENTITYSLNNGSPNSFTGNSESYNVRFAELEVKVADDDVNLFTGVLEKDADGTVFTREIEVRNSGLGRLSEYTFYVDVDNRIEFSELSLGNQVLTPTSTGVSPTDPNVNRYAYTFSDFSTIGNGDAFFDQNESMIFNDSVALLPGTCESALETNYTVTWGCTNTVCNEGDQEATSIAFLSFVSGRPAIFNSSTASGQFRLLLTVIDSGDICGDDSEVEIGFENRGSGSTIPESDAAFNLVIRDFNLSSDFEYTIAGLTLTDEDLSDNFLVTIDDNPNFTTDPDGVGIGLDDIDKDGFYDDLPRGQILTLRLKLMPTWDAATFENVKSRILGLTRIYYQDNNCTPSNYNGNTNSMSYFLGERSAPSLDLPLELQTNDTATLIFNHDLRSPTISPSGLLSFGNYLSDFTLPEGYVLNEVRWISNFGSTQTFIPQALGNNQYRVLGGSTIGRYELDVTVGCSDGAPEISNVSWKMYLDACGDFTDLQLINLIDESEPIFTDYDSCNTGGGGGGSCDFATDSFDVQRNTFGYTPPTQVRNGEIYYTHGELATAAFVNASTPDINLEAAYPRDKVLFQAQGKVLANATARSYDRLYFEFAFNLPEGTSVAMLNHETNGQLQINGSTFPLTNPTTSIDGNNRITYLYEIVHSYNNVSEQNITVSNLELQFLNKSGLNLPFGVHDLSIFRAKFYGKRMGLQEFGCSTGSVGTTMSLLMPSFSTSTSFPSVLCNGRGQMTFLSISSATTGDDFPNEFRPLFLVDDYSTTLPAGYKFGLDGYFTQVSNSSFPNTNPELPMTNTNPLDSPQVDFTFENNTVLEASERFGQLNIIQIIEADCETNFQVPAFGASVSYPRSANYIDLLESDNPQNINGTGSRFYQDVPFTISPNTTQEGFEESVSWPVLFCNESTSFNGNMSGTWIALELKTDDLRTRLVGASSDPDGLFDYPVVFYGQTADGLPKGMLVQVGSISQSTCVTVYPRVEYINCENDAVQNIDLLSSWSCGEYPLDGANQATLDAIVSIKDPDVLSCQYRLDEQELTLRYKTGDLTWEVNRLEDQVDLCEALSYEVNVLSSKFANVYDTELTVTLPQGITPEDIANIQYEYDGVIGLVNVANFIEDNTTTSNNFKVKVSELVTSLLLADGTPGIGIGDNTIPGSRLAGKNEITFTINLVADCTMDPGIPVQFNLDGRTNCNDNINLLFNRLFPINGVVLPELTIDVAASDFLVCNTQNQVDIILENNDPNPDVAQQELRLTLPQGVVYGGIANGTPSPVQNGNVLTWDIGDINTNRTQSFSIFTDLTDFNTISFDYTVDVVQNGQATCVLDAQACNLEITTAQGTDNAAQITLPQVTITPITSTPVCEGTPVTVAVELVGVTDYTGYEFDWNIAPVSQNNNQFTFELTNTAQLQLSVSPLGNNSPSCTGNASLDVEVYPGGSIGMSLIEGITCVGQSNASVSVTTTGEAGTGFTEQQPFEIVSASPVGSVTIGQFVNNGETITVENLPQGPFSISFRDNYGCTFEQTLNIPTIGNPITNFCTTLLPCGVLSGDVTMSFDTADLHSVLNGSSYSAVVTDNQTGTDISNFTGNFPDTQTHVLNGVAPNAAYTLEISADNGCVYTRPFVIETYQVTVSQPTDEELCFANETKDIIVNINDNIPTCSSFAVPTYEVLFGVYDVDSPDRDFIGTPQTIGGITNQLDLNGLGEGNYKIVVRPDASGYTDDISACFVDRFFSITSSATFSATLNTIDPLCTGEASGSAEVVINGGSGTFNYEWEDQSGQVISTGYRAIGLAAGNYQVTVTNAEGCDAPVPLTFTLTDPDPLEAPFIEDVQTACEAIAGSGGPTASGYTSGTAPYTFRWYEILTTTDFEGIEVTNESFAYQETVPEGGTSTYIGITPGDYIVRITDANGCTAESLVTTVTQPEVARQYNINLSWQSRVIQENENPNPRTFEVDPIGPSNYKLALSAQVERCIAETQEVSRESVANFLKDIEQINDTVSLAYANNSDVYHYTLYYYDRAGNLVRTVPPAGVNVATDGDGNIARVPTNHTYVTGYDYNSISQLGSQNTPDGGTTNFLYNDIGQLLYSQNERQIADNAFSYSIYDELGRIIEAGEAQLAGKNFPVDFLVNDQADESVALSIPLAEKVEYIQTTFNDRATITYQGGEQRFLRNRVSQIYNLDKNGQESYTYYSYDPHGNVEWIVQDLPSIGQTTVAYEYDLISGNVNEVIFNIGRVDEYHHQYAYDEDNRIISVKTSKDGHLWDEDARYDYYLHGPLARTELGEDRIQGLDFTYTIHGWLKGINTPDLAQNAFNPDGVNTQGDAPNTHAQDEFGMALGYYGGDFARDGVFDSRLTAANPFVLVNQINGTNQDLYNGNISTWTAHTAAEAKAKNANSYVVGNAYQYDQLNRIKEATAQAFNEASQVFEPINGQTDAFKTNYSYDGNGNLLTLQRFKDDGQLMDDLAYNYDLTDPNLSNKLTHVNDGVGQVSAEINDLPNQNTDNYIYDAIGQLVRDNSEGLTYVWNTSGKVSEIVPDDTGDPNTQKVHMKFTYDGMGNRIVKQVNRLPYESGNGPQVNNPEAMETTYYSLDAQGNVMGIYKREDAKVFPGDATDTSYRATFKMSERPMYGSDRIGQDTRKEDIYSTVYNFSGETDYNAVMLEFVEQINSVALGNVLLAQQVDQDIFDTDGNLITVPGTNLTTTTVDGEFVELLYNSMLIQDADGTPVITDNNIFLIEDVEENPLGYGVVASSYFNTDPEDGVMLIYDTDGGLINGLQLINSDTAEAVDYLAKSVVVKNPARNDEFFLFYKDVTGNLHTATLSTASGSLEVVATVQLGSSNYGRHMAVVDDRQMQRAFVYATTHTEAVVDVDGNITTPPQATLVRFAIDGTGTITEEGAVLDPFESYDVQGSGELQVALDGNTLSMYNYTALATQWTGLGEAELRTWQLNEDWLPLQSSTQQTTIGGNIGKGSLINTGADLYYTQRAQEVSTNTETVRIIRVSDGQVLANDIGDLRANKNNKFYNFTQGADNGKEYNLTATNIVSLNNLPTSNNGTTGYQPYQPYTINGVTPAATNGVVYRNVGEKYYELKDHLGNVRVVVSDRKNLDTNGNTLSANVVSYNNYYPFGSPLPGRTFDSQEYRYGFNGKEKDDEIKGQGLHYDYGFRVYDPRLGKFLSVDPLSKTYPWYTPYQYAGNKPISSIDLDGLEEFHYVLFRDRKGETHLQLNHVDDVEWHSWTAGNRNTRKQVKHVNESQKFILHIEQEVFRNAGPGVPKAGFQYVALAVHGITAEQTAGLFFATDKERNEIINRANVQYGTDILKYFATAAASEVTGGVLGLAIQRMTRLADAALDMSAVKRNLISKADEALPAGADAVNASVKGTKVHTEWGKLLKEEFGDAIEIEKSFVKGEVVKGGKASKGGVRVDAILYDTKGKPFAIFDLKTGKAGLTTKRIKEIRSQLPAELKEIPILEIRPTATKSN